MENQEKEAEIFIPTTITDSRKIVAPNPDKNIKTHYASNPEDRIRNEQTGPV